MENRWRPEEWKCPYWKPSSEDDIGRQFRWKREGKSKGEAFEEGADAMLEAIKEHFNLTMFSANYKQMPVVIEQGSELLVGIKQDGNVLPFFLSAIPASCDYVLDGISVSGKPLEEVGR